MIICLSVQKDLANRLNVMVLIDNEASHRSRLERDISIGRSEPVSGGSRYL